MNGGLDKLSVNHLDGFRQTLAKKKHLVGVAAGSGMTAKYAIMGGCDFLLALNSGKYRSMGVSSMAGFLSYSNSNDLVMDYACKEILRTAKDVPVFLGLNATDPTKSMYDYIKKIKMLGFAGINNYPTVGMIDGKFREALAIEGIDFQQEVEAIRFAHYCGLITLAFVFNAEQTREMAQAGADIICAHFGLTSGGYLGAQKVLTLERVRCAAQEIFEAAEQVNTNIIRVVYGGPIKTPIDAQYMYRGSKCQGFIGGSCFERIPIESAVLHTTRSFKKEQPLSPSSKLEKIIFDTPGRYDYVEFIKQYIDESYMTEVRLNELAQVLHCSMSYLSTLFSQKVGTNFQDYLIQVRMEKARDMIRNCTYPLVQVAQNVGYQDYAQFSKMYKKHMGISPREDSLKRKKIQK